MNEFNEFMIMELNDPSFREFLSKINFHNLCQYCILCQKLFHEDIQHDKKIQIVKDLAIYLHKPPNGKNLALRSQVNRSELLHYCQNIHSCNKINVELFKESYNYCYMKLYRKYEIYKKRK